MRELALGFALRILLGIIGAAAVIAGVAVGAFEMRHAVHGMPWTATVLTLLSVVVVCGGVFLLHGAWRGRIAVRDPAGRASRVRR
ncbi:MAG TPA: hypothetical protein VF461_15395 [Gemmatimonadaceae bacterium]